MLAPSVPGIAPGPAGTSIVEVAGSAVGGVNVPVTVLQARMKIARINKYKDGGSVFFILLSFNFLSAG
jgi:hypothetical protein